MRLRGETRFCSSEHRDLDQQQTQRRALEAIQRSQLAVLKSGQPEPECQAEAEPQPPALAGLVAAPMPNVSLDCQDLINPELLPIETRGSVAFLPSELTVLERDQPPAFAGLVAGPI